MNTPVIYKIIEEINTLDPSRRMTYGIAVCIQSVQSLASPPLSVIPGITSDKDRLRALVDRCNQLHLSPVHLEDILDDFLNE